ncbi:large ribosomal subunit protein uL23-like [Balaenoptera ricei]|uniref:large ribosomal subunit protein uL23-like n=1 Tax=Balaenoptera ricei TaxID=2746895 RepID=UPI0028BD6731|nr:large ribosomal subunit protein uL23-like [Balaenoptera ricei]
MIYLENFTQLPGNHFSYGIQKAKKGAHATPKPKPKTKAWKAKKAVLKSIHIHTQKKIACYPLSGWPKTPRRQPVYPWKSDKLKHYVIIKFPLSRELVMKKTEDSNTLGFIMNVKANKHQIKRSMKQLYNIDMAKVNTLIRADGDKKVYVQLATDYNALDVANKTEII